MKILKFGEAALIPCMLNSIQMAHPIQDIIEDVGVHNILKTLSLILLS